MAKENAWERYKELSFELKIEKHNQNTEPSLFYKGDAEGLSLALCKLVRTIVERGMLTKDNLNKLVDIALKGVDYGSK